MPKTDYIKEGRCDKSQGDYKDNTARAKRWTSEESQSVFDFEQRRKNAQEGTRGQIRRGRLQRKVPQKNECDIAA